MTKKLFDLQEKTIDIIHQVMEKEHIKSEVGAVTYMISKYEERASFAEEIVSAFNDINSEWMSRVKWATQETDKNMQIVLDIINTMVFKMGIEFCIGIDDAKSTAIAEAEEKLKRKIEKNKQRKDNKKRKSRT